MGRGCDGVSAAPAGTSGSGYIPTLDGWRATGAISVRRFYIRRAFRILPAAMLVLAATAALGLVGALPVSRAEVIGALFFFRN
jgi:peptidoglycan/LPS O-acetylase OafA/YrhL